MTYAELYAAWAHAQNLIRLRDETEAHLAATPLGSPEERKALSDALADIRRQLDETVGL